MRPVRWLALLACSLVAFAQEEVDSEESRKVLGSSVVTSVSVIMDHGNGTKTYITDAAGQPVDQTEGAVGSPVDLLNPDRYEFYTFDETGDLVKKLMTLDQIKGLLAGGDGESYDSPPNSPTFYHDSLSSSHLDDSDLEPNMAQGVHSVVASVQNVLRSELEASKTKGGSSTKPPLNIPDSISSWSMLFPAIIGDSSEALDDGNSVNDPIIGEDKVPASSNEEKTEVKISPDEALKIKESIESTAKPTAVPPIIHFLEIQSVPSPSRNPTKTPLRPTTSTTPYVAETSETQSAALTTNKPTSPVSSIQEMSASISSLLSQVTDKLPESITSADDNKVTTSFSPLPTTTKPLQHSEKPPVVIKPLLKPESSNIKIATTNPPENIAKPESSTVKIIKKPTKISASTLTTESTSKPTPTIISTTVKDNKNASNDKTENAIKKTTDAVVSLMTTIKPTVKPLKSNSTQNNKSDSIKTTASATTKQKLQATTPLSTSLKKNNVKVPTSTMASTHKNKQPPKKPTKPSMPVNKPEHSSDTLEAHSSEDVYKVVSNKPNQAPSVSNKNKNNNHTKSNVKPQTSTTKPVKKVTTEKPHTEEPHDCTHSKKTPPAGDLKFKENLAVAASSNLNERVKPTKVKTPILQEVKTVQKPSSPSVKPVINKIRPSDDVKITTYKPSTNQPFTTKQSTNKISTTTEVPSNGQKVVTSESNIHEVNGSLVDIKEDHVPNFNKKEETQYKNKVPVLNSAQNKIRIPTYENAASSINETSVSASLSQSNTTNKTEMSNINTHKTEPECTHGKKPVHTSIQDKISDISNDFAASNAEEIKLTTLTAISSTEGVTEESVLKDETTETSTEAQTKLAADSLPTTTEESEEQATDLPETTTLNMPEMDFVKEGISAVTNILLDQKPAIEPQQLPLPTLPLSDLSLELDLTPPVKGELKHASSFEDFELSTTDVMEENTTLMPPEESTSTKPSSTTEKEVIIYFTTTDPPPMDTTLPSTENSSISSNASEESTEQQVNEETTSSTEETTTIVYEQIELKESSESKIASVTLNNQTLPTKESKLSPEHDHLNETSESGVLCNHTLVQINTTKVPLLSLKQENHSTNTKDQLVPAQSVISEVSNSSNNIAMSPPPEPAVKNNLKESAFNIDLKTALRPDPQKYSQVKYPSFQNAYRPLHDVPAVNPQTPVELHPAPHESMGLEATTAFLADDVRRFSDLCNELAFRMWTSITGKGSISSRSLVLSPFATTSLLAMVFLGARGPTSGQMNDVLRLDDMVTFNPHQVLQNVTESVLNSRNYGVTTAAFVRELYSDKLKGKILDFYKERAQQYYDGHVEEIAFTAVGDILRRRTNLLVKRQTLGKVPEYLRGSNLNLRPPLAAFSANIFQTDCDLASTEGRDGEMYFVVRPSTRQRRLVPVPAAVWRTGFLAGYEPGLDATAVALGTDSVVSTVLVLPGQQAQVAPGDGLARLEQRLIETSYRRGGWTRLLRSLLPRPGLELQVPRFSHRSVLNISSTLQRMGLKDLFNENKADLRGLNGLSNDLHLSDMVQVNTFSTCGEDTIGARHHIETYPVSPQRMGREDPELYPRPEDFEDPELFKIPLNLRPRQARLPDNPRLRFDRPFLYMVRHNPTGMILHMGRFNPRLLP